MGEYISALNTLHEYVRATDTGEIPDNPAHQATVYKYLGNIHFVYFDYPAAIEWYEKALKKSSQLPDNVEQLKACYNLCLTHCITGNRAKAKFYANRIASLPNVDSGLRTYSHTMTEAFYEKHFGDKRAAIGKMKEAVGLVEANRLHDYLKFTPYAELSTYQEELGQYEEAIATLSKLEKELEKDPNYPSMLMECMKGYMSVYTKLGDSENALIYQNRYLQVSDSLMNRNRFLKANDSFRQKSSIESSSRLQSLHTTLSIQKAALTGVVLLMTVGILLYFLRVRRKTASKGTSPKRNISDIGNITGQRLREEISGQQQELFARICKTVDSPEGYADPECTIEKLAQKLETNVKYVSQAVNLCSGTNFRTFLNDRRIREAIARLNASDTDLSIHDIAIRVGFASQSAFIASFKRVTGTTPSRFQRMIRNEKNASPNSKTTNSSKIKP